MPSGHVAWYVSPKMGFKGFPHVCFGIRKQTLAAITCIILSTGSLETAAAFKYRAMGPPTDPYIYKMEVGAMHQIGNEVLAMLNFPVMSYFPT